MEIGFIVLAIAITLGILYFFLPSHLRRRFQAQVHYSLSHLSDRIQTMHEDWQAQELTKELLELVRDSKVAERLLDSSRKNNPSKPKKWHLDKIIYDLKRGR